MSNKTFKKLSVVKYSPNFKEATQVFEVPLTPPGDDQVLLKNHYAGVNATDVNITAGRYMVDGTFPFDIGLEAVGVVESVGKNVSTIKPGQAALVMCQGKSKAFSEYLYLAPEQIIPIPEPKPEYAALLVCGLTAAIGLDDSGRMADKEKVFITAAAGGLGHICVQWAKLRGCHVVGTCSTKDKSDMLKKLGCDRVINYKQENIDEVLTKEYPDGFDIIWETIGGKSFETLFKHLAVRGRLVVIGGITGYSTTGFPDVNIPDLPGKLILGSYTIVGFFLANYQHKYKEYLAKLIDLVSKGKIKILVDLGKNSKDGPFEGIDGVIKGQEHLHAGANLGKVVIKIN